MNKKRFTVGRFLLYAYVVASIIFILFPYVVMFFSSLKDLEEMFSIPATLLPKGLIWSNYVDIWKDVPLATYFKNSAIVAFGSTALCIVCAIPAAYALARMRFKGRRFVMSSIIVTQMFAPVVLLIGIYKIMVGFHLQNSLIGLVLLIAAFQQAFAIWILTGTFSTIPKELEEAAMIDGCSRLRSVIKVMMPLAAPGIVTATMFVFIAGWNEYTMALVLIGDTSLKTLNLGIQSFFGYTNTEWWYVFSASLLATLPILTFFQVLERHLVGGLTAGGVKG